MKEKTKWTGVIKDFITGFFLTFGIALIVSILVTTGWNYFAKGNSVIDWETSLRTALLFAIVIPLTQIKRKKAI